LNRLVDLFARFEGAFDPLCSACKEAEFEFESLVEQLHTKAALRSISLSDFRSHARKYCRARLAKEGSRYPCMNPEPLSETSAQSGATTMFNDDP
jgi:hypothetical protein